LTVLVSSRQRGNPLLKKISSVSWKYAQIAPDFVVGEASCILFLSIQYHLLHPDYLYTRMSEVKRSFSNRILLVHLDNNVKNSTEPLLLLTSLASSNHFSVILCTNLAECARYIETFKICENKSASSIQETLKTEFLPRLEDALTVIRSVNRTDVKVLSQTFGSLKNIIAASADELALCNGLGEQKIRRLHHCFNEPFLAPE